MTADLIVRELGTDWMTVVAERDGDQGLQPGSYVRDSTDLAMPALASATRDGPTHQRALHAVCRTVHFAHRRGVLHLDIKPENVMVGEFGEVYLVDCS